MSTMISRRGILKGLGAGAALLYAPAIIRAQSINAPARITPNRSVAILGNSRTFQCTGVSSTEYSKLAQGYIGWLQFLTNQAFDFSPRDNYGVSGDTTTQMLARTPAMLANTQAGTIVFLGGTNDRSSDLPYQTTIDNISTIRDLCLAANRRFVILGELCRGDSTFTSARFTATRLSIHERVQQWIKDQYAIPGVYVADDNRYLASPSATNGDCILGMTKDGIHPAPLGGYNMAKADVPLFNALFPPVALLPWTNSDAYDATNNPTGCLNSNPMMTGTGGSFNATGGSGEVADGWSENAGPTWTRAYSKIAADANGKTWQQVDIAGTGTASGVSLRQVITAGNLAVGNGVQALMDVEIDPSAANISQLALQLLDNNAITAGDMRRAVSTEVFPNTTDTIRGIMRTPVYYLTSTTLQLQFNMLVVNGATPAAAVRFGRVALRKV